MTIENPMDAFVMLLSNVRNTTERAAKIYTELGDFAQDPEVKGALDARAFVEKGSLAKIDEAFKLIGKKPVELPGKLQEIFIEDFRRDMNDIKLPAMRRIFALAKAIHLAHFRMGEWVALVAAADFTGHFGVGVLLETCLAEDLAFAERTRRFLRRIAEARIAAKAGV
jgi:ferritin-like metal-binding protein YciE